MSTLTGATVASTYKMLLKTSNATGFTGNPINIEDGTGTASSLYVGTSNIDVKGSISANISNPENPGATLHVVGNANAAALIENSSGYDLLQIGNSTSQYNVAIGDIDSASGGNNSYMSIIDSSNRIYAKATYFGINQTTPTHTLHVGNNDATAKFGLSSSTTAFVVASSTGNKIIVDTTNDVTTVTTDLIVEGNLETANRYYLEEYFYKRPGLNALIDDTDTEASYVPTNKHFELVGTNAANTNCDWGGAYAGIKLTTAGTDNDQIIVAPHLDAKRDSQADSAWSGILWGTENQVTWECCVTFGTNMKSDAAFWAGLKLTNTSVIATDADQAYFFLASNDDLGEIYANGNLHFAYSIGDAQYVTDLGISPTVLTQTYRLKISINADRKIAVYINGTQYGLTQKTYMGTDGITTTVDNHFQTGVLINNGSGYGSGTTNTVAVDGVDATTQFVAGDVVVNSSQQLIGTIASLTATTITFTGNIGRAVSDDEELRVYGRKAAATTDLSAALTNDIDLIPYVGVQCLSGSARHIYLHHEKISRVMFE